MSERTPKYLLFNGEIVPFEEAKVHVWTSAFNYGANVFEGSRAYWNEKDQQLYHFRADSHARRLRQSMKIMRMGITDEVEQLNPQTIELLRKNEIREDCHIRQVVFVNYVGPGHARTSPVGTVVSPYYRGRSGPEEGIHCCVSSWRRIDDNVIPPRVKCGANYQNSRMALMQATADGYDAVILLGGNGKVSEAQSACVFIVRDGVPITTPVTSGILESITRGTLLQLFQEVHNTEVQVRDIDRTELYVADEVFLCGSGAEILPVASIDRYQLGDRAPGPLTEEIRRTYFGVVRGDLPLYPEWRTPVYQTRSP
jgi:branched-chain amino acid aminotransferase